MSEKMNYIATNVLSVESLSAMERIVRENNPFGWCDLIFCGEKAAERYWEILQYKSFKNAKKILCVRELPDEFWMLCDSENKKVGISDPT